VVIEERLKKELLPLVSNVVVIGEKRKHLTCLISLSVRPDQKGEPTDVLEDGVRNGSTKGILVTLFLLRLENGRPRLWVFL